MDDRGELRRRGILAGALRTVAFELAQTLEADVAEREAAQPWRREFMPTREQMTLDIAALRDLADRIEYGTEGEYEQVCLDPDYEDHDTCSCAAWDELSERIIDPDPVAGAELAEQLKGWLANLPVLYDPTTLRDGDELH